MNSNIQNNGLLFEICQRNAPKIAEWILEQLPDIIKTHHGTSLRDLCYHLVSAELIDGEITIGHIERSIHSKIVISSGSVNEAWHDHLTQMILEPFIRHIKDLGNPPINCYTSILSQTCNSAFGINSDHTFISTVTEAFKELFNKYPPAERESSLNISGLISNFSKSINFVFHNSTKILNASSEFIYDDYKDDYDYDGDSHLVSSSETSVRGSDRSDYSYFNPESFALGVTATLSVILIYNCVSKTAFYQNLKSKVYGYLPDICKSTYHSALGCESNLGFDNAANELLTNTSTETIITTL